MRKIISIFIASILFLQLFSCGKSQKYVCRNIFTMSTAVSLNIPSDTPDAEPLFDETEKMIRDIESKLSATLPESDISRFNSSDSGIEDASDLCADIIRLSLETAEATDGAFDPSAGALSSLWDITGEGNIPQKSQLELAVSNVDYKKVCVFGNSILKSDPKIRLDVGGIAKGYALEKTVELLCRGGARYGMVSFGGNVGVWGTKPDSSLWRIMIKDPYDTSKTIGSVSVSEGYISVSGDYERYFERDGRRYHHIFDTSTGYPCDNGTHSVAVYTKNGALGDALSTALFVMGYEKATQLYDSGKYEFEALFITESGIKMTEKMKEMFTENK